MFNLRLFVCMISFNLFKQRQGTQHRRYAVCFIKRDIDTRTWTSMQNVIQFFR